jgi:hypothetical protein
MDSSCGEQRCQSLGIVRAEWKVIRLGLSTDREDLNILLKLCLLKEVDSLLGGHWKIERAGLKDWG